MTWTDAADLRRQVLRLWERGELPRAMVAAADAPVWPLKLKLRGPGPQDLSDRFDAVRAWVAALAEVPHVRLEWRERNHRVQGRQRLPVEVWLDDLDSALALIGKRREAQRFQSLWQTTASQLPELLPWLERRPLYTLELHDRWPRLLAVVRWLRARPRPGVYLRQVDAFGVDSKFIEGQRGVLAELLDLALPPEAIDDSARGASQFARRYGFLDKPVRIRLRLLDHDIALLPGCRGPVDLTLDADSFAALELPVTQVFITENETNFLAFPPLARALVIFGSGYGMEALGRVAWLQRSAVHYWGDLDTHGFAILDQLRAHLPHTQSFLMDRATLLEHRAHWGQEPDPVRHELFRLTPNELALFQDLRQELLGERLRLEQERVGYGWLTAEVAKLAAGPGNRSVTVDPPPSDGLPPG